MRAWLALLAFATTATAADIDLREGLDEDVQLVVGIKQSPPNLLLAQLITHASGFRPEPAQRALLNEMLDHLSSGDGLADELMLACEYVRLADSERIRDRVLPDITDAVDILENPQRVEHARLAAAVARCGAAWRIPRLVRSAERSLLLLRERLTAEERSDPDVFAAVLDVFEAGGDPRFLTWAADVRDVQPWKLTAEIDPRRKWSGQFARLGRIVGDRDLLQQGLDQLRLVRGPHLFADRDLLLTLVDATEPHAHLTVVGRPDEPATRELLAAGVAAPCLVDCLAVDDGPEWSALRERFPSLPAPKRIDGKPTAYLSSGATAFPPLTDAADAAELIRWTLPSPPTR